MTVATLQTTVPASTNVSRKNQYVIGDLQGCYSAFVRLLEHINFNPQQDILYFAGDLVARGEDSLSTLRKVKSLCEQGAAQTVLGNHDITLIASWRQLIKVKAKDNISPILQASDCEELLNWLRRQPLLLSPTAASVLVHAGIPPHWHIDDAKGYAKQVEAILQADLETLDTVLPKLYQRGADDWYAELDEYARLRAITNYFTRMRLCDAQGNLELSYKEGLDGEMPAGFRPWFEWQSVQPRQHRIYFGHWAALKAQVADASVQSTDGGCVWGGEMVAYRLNDNKTFSVAAD